MKRFALWAAILIAGLGGVPSATAVTNTLIAANATWRYLDDGTDQGTAWFSPAFEDSSWASGAAQLGYGDNPRDEATLVSYGPNSNNKYITTYFRHRFTVPDPSIYTVLRLRIRRDDGVVVYLNGVEVFRSNMPQGPVNYLTFGQNANDDGNADQIAVLPPAGLLAGDNVVAAEIHQDSPTSSDISFELELLGSTDPIVNRLPSVAIFVPAENAFFTTPADIFIAAGASDSDGGIARVEFFQGTAKLGEATSSPYTFSWTGVPAGSYALRAVAVDLFNGRGTSAPVNITVGPSAAPVVASKNPTPGNISSLSQITVNFSDPVGGVNAGDLLVNGIPALSVSGSGTSYTFTVPHQEEGSIFVAWAGRPGIEDFENPPLPFDPYGAGARWQYTLTDTVAPIVAHTVPAPGALVRSLDEVEITFSEPVTGLQAADLLINGTAASAVTGTGAGPYVFTFAQPANGTATLSWANGHGIRDLAQAGNAFAGGNWNYTLNTAAVFEGQVVINEIMYHPSSERTDEEWIELFNRGTSAVNLTGWALTRGANFVFPNVNLPAGGYLVVAANVAAFQARYPGVNNVVGGWSGQLNNSSEDVELEDASGERVDLMVYADEGDSAVRQRQPVAPPGWDWVAGHDGAGSSLELRNAALSNDHAQNWGSSSTSGGTPGAANSIASANLPPLILDVTHRPAVPKSSEPITVVARIVDEQATGTTVKLFWRNASTANPPAFGELTMFDDGFHGDGGAGDGVYGGVIPAQANLTIIEFYVQATDGTAGARTWPPAAADGSGNFVQAANALLQVDDSAYGGTQPIYRVILTESDRAIFATQNRNIEALINCSFITIEGGQSEIRYNSGIRYRGAGSRGLNPPTYRVNFASDRPWNGKTAINLNSQYVHTQVLGSQVATKAGLVAEYATAVQLRINGTNPANSGATQYGSYAAVEPTNDELMENHLPDDAGGNVYRASTGNHSATLNYVGTSPDAYIAAGYLKNSNVSENDWSDLIRLTYSLDPLTTSDSDYMAAVRRNVNVEMWLRYFAVCSLMEYAETALASGRGDDYGLYRGVEDPRFIILTHDFDTIFGTSANVNRSIYVATAVGTINRFLRHPEIEPRFHAEFRRLLAGTFATNSLFPMIDRYLGDWVPSQVLVNMKNFIVARNAAVELQLPPAPALIQATISGEPPTPTYLSSATLTVGGENLSHYRHRLNGGAWSAATPISTPIALSSLADGAYTVEVIGSPDGTTWQAESEATISQSWVVISNLRRVMLNEVLARNVTAVNHSGTFPDLVELYNPRAVEVDLSGLRLTDDLGQPNRFVFPANTTLAAGGYLVLYATAADGTPGLHLGFGLGQNGDSLYLLDTAANGERVLDSVTFGMQLADQSIGRDTSGRWRLCTPTFGTVNIAAATGSQENLKINEWLANGAPPFVDDFVELYNPDPLPVAVGGLFLTDRALGLPFQHEIVPLSFLAGYGYQALVADADVEAGADHLNFQLSSEIGEIALLGPGARVIDCVIYGPQQAGISEGRAPNGSDRIVRLSQPTPGAPNPVPPPPIEPILVNFLPINDTFLWRYQDSGADLGTSWIQPGFDDSSWGSGPALLGWEFDSLPEPLRTQVNYVTGKITYYFRARFNVPAGLNLSGVELNHIIDDGAVFYLNGAELTRFNMPSGTITSSTPASSSQDASIRGPVTIPFSSLLVGTNVLAVEVHQNSFNSSDIVMGARIDGIILTNPPSAAGILINEVLASADAVTNASGVAVDWIELMNPSDGAVDLANMSLTDRLTESRRWVFPAGSIIPAQGYLTVYCDPNSPPSTNVTGSLNTGFGLSSSGDSAYLFNRPQDGGELLSGITFGIQVPDFAVGRLPNGGSNWSLTLPSASGANIAATLGDLTALQINEWLADPVSGEDWFELYNPGTQPVALGGLYLTDDLNDPTKSPIPSLSFIGTGPAGYVQFFADNNPSAGATHAAFRLSGSGESIGIARTNGVLFHSVAFGQQLEDVSEGRLPDGSSSIVNFRGSASPAEANYRVISNVVIHEVLTHTDTPLEDAVELFNPTAAGVDISGWYLSDRRSDPARYRIPQGTVIPARGFAVIYEYQFNPDFSGLPPYFGLDSVRGEEVVLSEANASGALTGYRTTTRFNAAENGVSFGRHRTSTGDDFTAMSARTFGVDSPADPGEFRSGRGTTNAAPRVGPVVVSEIFYHPPDVGTNDNSLDEFIELRNVTASAVALFDPAFPTNTWRLRDAVDYEFPGGVTLPAGNALVVVSFNPVTNLTALAAFRQKYNVSETVPVYGPWRGKLDNSTENVELYKPEPPQGQDQPDAGYVPYVQVDKVKYFDSSPWPSLADGSTNGVGYSLSRRVLTSYGNEPTNWIAAVPTPCAETAAPAMVPPVIQTISAAQAVNAGANADLFAAVSGAGLKFQWYYEGQVVPGATNLLLTVTNVQPGNAGEYSLVAANGGGAASASTRVDVRSQPVIARQPQSLVAAMGQPAVLNVLAAGAPPLGYQWRRGTTDIPGATSASLLFSSVQPADQGSYRVVVSNAFGVVTSEPATLTVETPPTITQQPQGADVLVGTPVTLTVAAEGTAPLRYQWRLGTVNLIGQTNATLTLSNPTVADSGVYRVLVSNNVGSQLSDPAVVVVNLPPTVRVVAADAAADEVGGNTGRFSIERVGRLVDPLQVRVAISGSAAAGSDYTPLEEFHTIPAGSSNVTVTVSPLNDSELEGSESVILTIVSQPDYDVGNPASAAVFITDDDNQAPLVQITAPAANEVRHFPASITIAAVASDADGSISKVDIYADGTNRLATLTAQPYTITWTNASVGTHQLTAIATDNLGAFRVSDPVSLIVNAPPTVAITSPTSGSLFNVPATINVAVSAGDADGTVTQVDLFANGSLLASWNSAPYTIRWSNVPESNYVLTARATDNRGAITTSAAVSIGVVVPTPTFADKFAERGLISGFTNQVRGTNTSYTKEPGEPRHENRSGTRSAWISWTAPASGTVAMNTFGSSFDTVLSIYTGSSVSNLTRVAGNDDANDLMVQSAVSFPAVGGTSYQIAVDGYGPGQGGIIVLSVELPNLLPVIVTAPQSLTVTQGNIATFTAVAGGPAPLTYRWQFNGVTVATATGGTSSSYTRNNAQPNHAGNYTVIVTNVYGAVTSAPAVLVVKAFPTITSQPLSTGVVPGDDAFFSVTATGTGPLTYQWRFEGVDIPNATQPTLVVSSVQVANEGFYTVVVRNEVGSATSVGAYLQVVDGLVVNEFIELIPMQATWKFDQAGVDRGSTWREVGFDDTAWSSGQALLGFEDSTPNPYPVAIRTPLTSPQAGGPITVYFRTPFTFTNVEGGVTLFSENLVDDGAVYYLNGAEVGRLRMSANATNFNSLAQTVGSEGQPNYLIFPATNLVVGQNLFAVEVHQSSATSSDVVFGMALNAIITTTNRPAITEARVINAGQFQLTLQGISGRIYAIDSSDGLGAGWSAATTFSNFTGSATWIDTAAAGRTNRFYRGRLVK